MGVFRPRSRSLRGLVLLAAGLAAAALGVAGSVALGGAPDRTAAVSLPPAPPEATAEQVRRICGACHATPPPDSFPRSAWRQQIKQGYDFFRDSDLALDHPSIESVAAYYENRAPLEL